jgi:hypothetical protein
VNSTDQAARRHERYQRWTENSHPLLREIGEQLARGQIRPGDLLADPDYRELIQTGLTRIQRESARLQAERSATQAAAIQAVGARPAAAHRVQGQA